MNKKFPKPPCHRTSMFHSTHEQHRKEEDQSKKENNLPGILFERTEQITYDFDRPTSSRYGHGTMKTHKVVSEIPFESGNHQQFHRVHHYSNIKSERPYYSTPPSQLPEFHRDFGLFGKTVQRSLAEEADDPYYTGTEIADLFDRRADQKLKYPYTKCFATKDGNQNCKDITKPPEEKHDNGAHTILAKYISRGHEDQMYKDNYKEKNPDFFLANKPHNATEGTVCANAICVTQQPSKEHITHKAEVKESKNHVFPFKETKSGHLLIDPQHVAFENHKLSVLVANPKKTKLNININDDATGEIQAFSEWRHEKLSKAKDEGSRTPVVAEDPEEIRNFLLKINSSNNNEKRNDANQGDPRHEESFSMDNEYSTASRGTEKYMDNLHNRIKKAIHPDTYVIIGNKSFPCHSVALQVSSTFFENIKRPKPNIHKIELPEKMVSAQIFPSVMEWMLQNEEGRKSMLGKDNVIALYVAAVFLHMKELQDCCLEYIHTNMSPGDPLLMRMWDEVKTKPNCQDMMAALATKAASLFPDLYKSKKFLRLEVDELTMLLASDQVVINNELQIFDAAIRWLLFDWFNRKLYISAIMRTVRFGLMSPLNLTQINHCPDTFRERSANEYNQILNHPEVKALMDAGLAFAILRESYAANPEELKKWLETTKIEKPRSRINMLKLRTENTPLHSVSVKFKDQAKSVAKNQSVISYLGDKNRINDREVIQEPQNVVIERNPASASKDVIPINGYEMSTPKSKEPEEGQNAKNWQNAYPESNEPAPTASEVKLRDAIKQFTSKDRNVGDPIIPKDTPFQPTGEQPVLQPKPKNFETIKSLGSAAIPTNYHEKHFQRPEQQSQKNLPLKRSTDMQKVESKGASRLENPPAKMEHVNIENSKNQANFGGPNGSKLKNPTNPRQSGASNPSRLNSKTLERSKSVDPSTRNSSQEPKAFRKTESKLMQPKYFSGSSKPDDSQVSGANASGLGSKQAEDSQERAKK